MNIWALQRKYENTIIKEYRNVIKSTHDKELLKELYLYLKKISMEFYDGENMHSAYIELKNNVIYTESIFEGEYILDTLPKFESDNEQFMDKLVHHIRLYLLKSHWIKKSEYERSIKELDFVNDCVKSSEKIKEICYNLGIECKSLIIHPGYDEKARLFYGCGYHAFNIVHFCGEYYIVDCTYRQFFNVSDNLIQRLGIVELAGCKAGCFMIMDENRKRIAESLLRDGYVKMDEQVLKDYLDGFTISFRNGLYYEETNDFSFKTEYTFDDYINFFNGKDSQLKHEDRHVLGYQQKPLSKYDLF